MTNEEILYELCRRGLDERFRKNPRTIKNIGNLVKYLMSKQKTSPTQSGEESISVMDGLIAETIGFDSYGNPTKACIRINNEYFEYFPPKRTIIRKGKTYEISRRLKLAVTETDNIVLTLSRRTIGPDSECEKKICFVNYDKNGRAIRRSVFTQTFDINNRVLNRIGREGRKTDQGKLRPIIAEYTDIDGRRTYEILPKPEQNTTLNLGGGFEIGDANSTFDINRLCDQYGTADLLPSIDDICEFLSFFNDVPLKYEEVTKARTTER